MAISVIIDLTVRTFPTSTLPTYADPARRWHRVEKELHLHTSEQTAWLYVARTHEEQLSGDDLLVVDIRIGEQPLNSNSSRPWESRPCGIWLLRSKFSGNLDHAVTEVDVLFGVDAVDPRPQWTLMRSPLHTDAQSDVPVAKLSVRRGGFKSSPGSRPVLRVGEEGKFKIVQISDTHMVTGVGICKDAVDAHGDCLPDSEADPLTMDFMRKVLDLEKPDLVVLAGDQLHHDIPDSQSALFKVVAPIIERSVPFAAVFGNHDSEGVHALSRTAQMSMLQALPFSLCEPGPQQVDGVGNYYLKIMAPAPSQRSLSTLYFLDSHGEIPSRNSHPNYDPIKQSQIDWFVNVSRAQQRSDKTNNNDACSHLSLVFQHIPLPEFGDARLSIQKGHRREPTEGPNSNTHFYDALAKEDITALGCGHDHVNDFCALLPQPTQHDNAQASRPGPWLCYGGGSGFGGYCSYGKKRYHRRMRVWELDTMTESLKTWMRVEYADDRVDEIVLVRRSKQGN